jgi:hypothetical protein
MSCYTGLLPLCSGSHGRNDVRSGVLSAAIAPCSASNSYGLIACWHLTFLRTDICRMQPASGPLPSCSLRGAGFDRPVVDLEAEFPFDGPMDGGRVHRLICPG